MDMVLAVVNQSLQDHKKEEDEALQRALQLSRQEGGLTTATAPFSSSSSSSSQPARDITAQVRQSHAHSRRIIFYVFIFLLCPTFSVQDVDSALLRSTLEASAREAKVIAECVVWLVGVHSRRTDLVLVSDSRWNN